MLKTTEFSVVVRIERVCEGNFCEQYCNFKVIKKEHEKMSSRCSLFSPL